MCVGPEDEQGQRHSAHKPDEASSTGLPWSAVVAFTMSLQQTDRDAGQSRGHQTGAEVVYLSSLPPAWRGLVDGRGRWVGAEGISSSTSEMQPKLLSMSGGPANRAATRIQTERDVHDEDETPVPEGVQADAVQGSPAPHPPPRCAVRRYPAVSARLRKGNMSAAAAMADGDQRAAAGGLDNPGGDE